MITTRSTMVKEKKSAQGKKIPLKIIFYFLLGSLLAGLFLISFLIVQFEKTYSKKIYRGVRIDGVSFGGKTPKEIEAYFLKKSLPFAKLKFTLSFEDKIATVSGQELAIAYDSKLSAIQAYSIGRSGHILSDTYQKWRAATSGINLPSVLKMNHEILDEVLNNLSLNVDLTPQDGLFQFEKGKVTSFRLSKSGRALDKLKTKQIILSYINSLKEDGNTAQTEFAILLPVDEVLPKIKTEDSNSFGIKELIAIGASKFAGSIPGRIHNIQLASSRINGHLVPPGGVFSFNDTLGDVSSSTGFQPAYIIKGGRTVLGDGGGVCQVSTTLFRAVLNSGLPIIERHQHSYRVSYYEQGSPPGIDATVFAPGYDFRFKNDTDNYLLIQSKIDNANYSLIFEIYGASDGRQAEVTKPVIFSQIPPPPDLFQDEPTLLKGVIKQVDWKAWGAKVNFDYKVTKNGEVINQQSFYSNFQPWQAVFLRGIKE